MLDSSYMRSLKMQQPINIEHKLSLITEHRHTKSFCFFYTVKHTVVTAVNTGF